MEQASNPPSLADKLRQLQEVEDTIDSLRSQLLVAETLREEIKRDVASCKSSSTKFSTIPPELLCLIFSLVDEEQHMCNAKLALVCKAWRNLVVGTPQFWTHVVLKWAGDVPRVIACWDYIRTCVERSAGTPMDIILDFEALPHFDTYVSHLEWRHFEHLDLDPFSLVKGSQGTYLPGVAQTTNFNSLRYYAMVENSIRMLKRDNPVTKWRSLRLTIPANLRFDFFGTLSAVPGISEDIKELEYTVGGYNHRYDERKMPMIIPPLRKLQLFSCNQYITLQNESTIGRTLTSLTLGHHRSSQLFLSNAGSRFKALKYLSIYVQSHVMDDWEPLHIEQTIHLPSLTVLGLEGDGHKATIPYLDVPRLSTLHLGHFTLQHCSDVLVFPEVKELMLDVPGGYTGLELGGRDGVFQLLVGRMPLLVCITVRCETVYDSFKAARRRTSEAFDDMQTKGMTLHPSLKVFVTERDGALRHEEIIFR